MPRRQHCERSRHQLDLSHQRTPQVPGQQLKELSGLLLRKKRKAIEAGKAVFMRCQCARFLVNFPFVVFISHSLITSSSASPITANLLALIVADHKAIIAHDGPLTYNVGVSLYLTSRTRFKRNHSDWHFGSMMTRCPTVMLCTIQGKTQRGGLLSRSTYAVANDIVL